MQCDTPKFVKNGVWKQKSFHIYPNLLINEVTHEYLCLLWGYMEAFLEIDTPTVDKNAPGSADMEAEFHLYYDISRDIKEQSIGEQL